MKTKYLLYIGILLLLLGVMARYFTPYAALGLGLVIIGVILKLAYIGHTILQGLYRPRAEIFLLLGGLTFLFLGLWHKLNVSALVGYAMIAAAVILKVVFIMLFIRKIKRNQALLKP